MEKNIDFSPLSLSYILTLLRRENVSFLCERVVRIKFPKNVGKKRRQCNKEREK